jgi:aryl-alcohol dehydrogenase-like predicted oxidoreductase
LFHQTAGFTLGEASESRKRLGFGLAALGRPGYINLGHADDLHHDYDMAAMEARAHAVLDTAWAGGVRYFDAARSYGAAEQFLASWLNSRRIAPEDVVIGSKWGYTYTAGWKVEAEKHEIKDHTLPVLLRQSAESRHLLGTHLHLYQIHSATLESGVLDDRGVLTELARMRSTTGVKIGLTLSGPRQAETLQKAQDVEIEGRRVFDCVQATWNLLEPSVGPALQAAHDAGMGVIVKEALANGRLTSRNQDAAFAEKRRLLEAEANRLSTTPDALALAAVLAQPWVDVVLSGAATVEQLQSNLGAAAVRWDEEAERRLSVLRETPEAYWSERGWMTWN